MLAGTSTGGTRHLRAGDGVVVVGRGQVSEGKKLEAGRRPRGLTAAVGAEGLEVGKAFLLR